MFTFIQDVGILRGVVASLLLGGGILAFYHVIGRTCKRRNRNPSPETFGFFHPYCSGGGGGERVLWKMIQILQQQEKQIVIYTIDPPDTNEAELRKDAERRFDVEIPHPIKLISLYEYKHFLDSQPFLSLLMESWGTMKLAHQAIRYYQPDVFCDTTGCAFTFLALWWKLPATWIVAYVHYPTISTDMMAWEWKKTERARYKTLIKLLYYWVFAILYGMVGSLADLVLVNSTWTYNHIHSLWRWVPPSKLHIVYPPCRVPNETSSSVSDRANHRQRQPTIVSIGQFRPEKNHALQIQSLARLYQNYPQHKNRVRLRLIGSCRNEADQQRVHALQQLVNNLALPASSVQFDINPPYSELQASMQSASMGIHTMRQEHFGIGIVEMMAAGLLTIAHNSGGPKSDIVEPNVTGFLAVTADEYADCIHNALSLNAEDSATMRQKAQVSATRFSDAVFDRSIDRVLPLLIRA